MNHEDKETIFAKIKSILEKYSNEMQVTVNSSERYDLETTKEVIIDNRIFPRISFANVMIHKGFVGFYLMPIYMNDASKIVEPELLKCLKGKTCFHIKKYDEQLFKQIDSALTKGLKAYKDRGWI